MDMEAYISEIKLELGGSLLDLELSDSDFQQVVNSAFREIQRYIDTTKLATIPYHSCIDLTDCGVSSVSRVFRSKGYLTDNSEDKTSNIDPMYIAQWQLLGGQAGGYNLSSWIYNFASWNSMLQIRNTISTDLSFRYDRSTNKLYINVSGGIPDAITIEYVPRFNDVSEIVSDYWIDMLLKLAKAKAKIIFGRIRTRFTQNNAIWAQDGEKMLEEGNTELAALTELLRLASQLSYPID